MNQPHFPDRPSQALNFNRSHGLAHTSASAATGAPPSMELERFIADEICSVEQLEILLWVFQNKEGWWDAAQVYDVVKSSLHSVQDRLDQFADRKILRKNGCHPPCYQFNAENEKRTQLIAELDAQYRERRVRVVQLIYSQPSRGATEFARAFRIRGED